MRRRRGAVGALTVVAGLLCAGTLAPSAWTARVDPTSLVLRASDVRGYTPDPPNTSPVPNAFEARTTRGRERVRQSGRLTGYRATFIDTSKRPRVRSVGSEASVFRSERGAHHWFLEVDRDIRRNAASPYARSRPRLGDEAWLVSVPGLVVVFWRHRTVFGMLTTTFVSRDRALSLARAQQRRIVSALR